MVVWVVRICMQACWQCATRSPMKQHARAPHASRYFPNTAPHANPPITSENVTVMSPIAQSAEAGTTTPCVHQQHHSDSNGDVQDTNDARAKTKVADWRCSRQRLLWHSFYSSFVKIVSKNCWAVFEHAYRLSTCGSELTQGCIATTCGEAHFPQRHSSWLPPGQSNRQDASRSYIENFLQI